MWEEIELRELRVFLALAEELHFGRTAERLHLTRSRISQSLRELEQKLGGQLVHRTSRRVSLTALGERFREEAGGAYGQLVDVFERTSAANRSLAGTLSLGLFSRVAAGPHLVAIVEEFEARYPQCHVQVSQLAVNDLFGPLRSGEVDLIAAWLPHEQPDLVTGPILARQPRVLAVARDHPLAERERVSIEEVADYRVARLDALPESILPSRTPSGRPIPRLPVGARRLDMSQLVMEVAHLVARGTLVHPTVPAIEPPWSSWDIAYIPISDLPPARSGLVWRRRASDPRLREFARVAREVLRS